MENLVDDTSSEGLVTFPDEHHDGDLQLELAPDDQLQTISANGLNSSDTVKFEQKRTMNTSKTKFRTNGFSSEQVRSVFFLMIRDVHPCLLLGNNKCRRD